ncbi:MAG: hypothetical protein RLZZ28_2686 [Bacteroidota bacterium]
MGNPLPNTNTLDFDKLKELVSHIPGALYRCKGDAYLTLEYFSEEIEKLSGYSLDYFMQNPLTGYSQLIFEEDREYHTDTVRKALNNQEKYGFEYRIRHKNGEPVWVYESGKAVVNKDSGEAYIDGCIFDITRRKQAEDALRQTRDELKRLALVAHNTTNSVMITDAAGYITWVNEGYTRISGYTLEELRTKKIGYSLLGGAFDEKAYMRIRQAVDSRTPYTEEFISHKKNGQAIWLHVDCQPMYDETGEFLGFMAIENDITERKETLIAREELVQRLTLATNSAEIGIFEVDLATNEAIWDDRMYEIYGYPKDTKQSLFKIFGSCVHPDDAESMRNTISELLSQKKEINGAVYRIIIPDGTIKYIESHAIIKKSESGWVMSLIGTNRDITEEVIKQEKIKMQNKVLRDIAFIQSHEVRKPLANILGMIEILHNSGALNDLEMFHHLVESARELDQQIRTIVNKTNEIDDELFR